MVRNSFIRLYSSSGIHAHTVTQTHTRRFSFVYLPPKYMHVYNRIQTETKSGHSSFNLIHSVNVRVRVSACSQGGRQSTVLIQLIFPQKEWKKRKIDTAARF